MPDTVQATVASEANAAVQKCLGIAASMTCSHNVCSFVHVVHVGCALSMMCHDVGPGVSKPHCIYLLGCNTSDCCISNFSSFAASGSALIVHGDLPGRCFHTSPPCRCTLLLDCRLLDMCRAFACACARMGIPNNSATPDFASLAPAVLRKHLITVVPGLQALAYCRSLTSRDPPWGLRTRIFDAFMTSIVTEALIQVSPHTHVRSVCMLSCVVKHVHG